MTEKPNPYGSEFQDFVDRVKRELIPKLQDTDTFVSVCPIDPKEVDIKFAVELGCAIMLDKPVIAAIRPGTKVPEHLMRVADKIVELDLDDPNCNNRLMAAVNELHEEMNG